MSMSTMATTATTSDLASVATITSRREEPAVPDRRENPWRLTPPLIIQIVVLVLSIGSFYLLSERRTTVLESSATNLRETAIEIRSQINTMSATVQSVSGDMKTLQAELNARGREIEDLKAEQRTLKAHIDVLGKEIAGLQARQR